MFDQNNQTYSSWFSKSYNQHLYLKSIVSIHTQTFIILFETNYLITALKQIRIIIEKFELTHDLYGQGLTNGMENTKSTRRGTKLNGMEISLTLD